MYQSTFVFRVAGNVISALSDEEKRTEGAYVPYRDSKLTRMLQVLPPPLLSLSLFLSLSLSLSLSHTHTHTHTPTVSLSLCTANYELHT